MPLPRSSKSMLVAGIVVALTLAVRFLMAPLWETTAPFALFMIATVIAGWYGGTIAAIVTGVAGLVTRLYFDSPRTIDGFPVPWEEAVRLTLFAGYVAVTAVLLDRMRADRRDLEASIAAARREIDERRRVEAALRDSEQRLQQLADAMPQIVWTAGPSGLEYFNQRWVQYTGLSLTESLAPGSWRRVVHPDDVEGAVESWARAVRDRTSYEVEYRLKEHASGEYRWFLGRAVPIRDAAGQVVRWFGTYTDIDEQKHTEQALETARAAAEEANHLKDEFLAMVSHELRTPLNAIVGWVSLLRAGSLSPERSEHALEVIQRNAKSQSQIVSDLIDVARSLTGRLHLEPARIDAAEVVAGVVESNRPAADARGISVAIARPPEPLWVWADRGRLEQIASNLVVNAVKFTPPGGAIDVQLGRRDGYAQLVVADTGRGIAPEFLPNVFQRFRQADTGSTRTHGGLGLGLAIVRQLVELHGGCVTAESPGVGLGSTFTVLLPAHTGQALLPASRTPAGGLRILEGVRLLVVDDEEDSRGVAAAAIETAGGLVRTAGSADEGFELAARERFDAWIFDIAMPATDGCELLQRLRRRPAAKGGATPALALSAYTNPRDRARAVQSGFQRYVTKPVSAPALVAEIVALLRVGRHQSSV